MCADNANVEPHRNTRRAHAAETAQDYVKAIQQIQRDQGKCRVIDLARRFDVSHVTVCRIVARLKRERLAKSLRYGPIELTNAGRKLAAHSQLQHRLVYDFLRAIGVSEEVAAIDAEGIEHHVSPQTLDCFRRLVFLARDQGCVSGVQEVA